MPQIDPNNLPQPIAEWVEENLPYTGKTDEDFSKWMSQGDCYDPEDDDDEDMGRGSGRDDR